MVLEFFGSECQVEPVGLVKITGVGGRGAVVETEGQGVGGGEAAPGSCETLGASFGAFFLIHRSDEEI